MTKEQMLTKLKERQEQVYLDLVMYGCHVENHKGERVDPLSVRLAKKTGKKHNNPSIITK